MWILNFGILLLCATGISAGILVEAQSNSIDSPRNNHAGRGKEYSGILRFACPVGFFRLKRNCYYLSGGIAQWRDAYFHCKDRNSTLAVLDKKSKDRILRKYLMGDQFTKLERWIGGNYDWQQMAWQWNVIGEKVEFENFAKPVTKNSTQYEWHCILLDPHVKYKWMPRSCLEKKHFICEVPAGRIERRRKKTIDPALAPQNQRLKKRRNGKRRRKGNMKTRRRGRVLGGWRKDWVVSDDNQEWANGVKLGSRPLSAPNNATEMHRTNRTRHRLNRNRLRDKVPKIIQITPESNEYSAFLGDGPAGGHPQALADDKTMSQHHAKINELSFEEVLLKT